MKSFNNSEITSIKNGRRLTIENDGQLLATRNLYSMVKTAGKSAEMNHKGFTFGRTVVNANRVEAARVESGSLRTALFAMYIIS